MVLGVSRESSGSEETRERMRREYLEMFVAEEVVERVGECAGEEYVEEEDEKIVRGAAEVEDHCEVMGIGDGDGR